MPAQTEKKKSVKPFDASMPSVRKMDFEGLQDLSPHYISGNSVLTHAVNSYHILFPEGERFFIKSVKAFADQVQDPALKERIKAFIGQEVQHGKEHEKVWDALRKQGRPVDRVARFYHFTAFKIFFPLAEILFGKKLKLSVTAALEHYTATLGEIGIENRLHEYAEGDMRRLLLWHACEEIEHKSVAFDVLKTVSKSYFLRVFGFVIATLLFWGYAIGLQYWFLLTDKEVSFSKWREDLKGSSDYMRVTVGPIAKAALRYFRRDFHPDQSGGYELATWGLASL
ncbi:metal-dependent hydrolase [Leptospira perolatii]|uniref:Metal-dependent hydrolase n=1 Tax=Leptospira perolatii TaxID=2023191 RepID=A0A2M9ZM73_9LEPT|nr:metal-dependent hydrolase [Leptospira perolatii]PJZ69852.1 metal-dependent hydrolase [Leptospira perolatii]PJZ73166.1 metal-dependent hydrolase [Leptospira perolatii]